MSYHFYVEWLLVLFGGSFFIICNSIWVVVKIHVYIYYNTPKTINIIL